MTLWLVRHGRAAAGVEDLDPGLDALGAKQARAAAGALRDVGATRVVVSPLRRTRETAAPIAEALGVPIEIRDEVAEVFDPSWLADQRKAMIGPLLSGAWSEQSPALREWRARVVRTLVSLGAGERVVVVSHFVAIGVAIGEATGSDRVTPLAIPNASITRVEITGDRLVLGEPPSMDHLAADEVTHAHTAMRGIKSSTSS